MNNDDKVNFPIDLVVPYVNNTTTEWQKTYVEFCSSNGYPERVNNFDSERYRDWGYFRYFFRGIEKNLPFINKVFLILQDKDQVPKWLDKKDVVVVYHRDFIPPRFLPTYNSTTIEMFLNKIPGLSEHFIYTNDDMYPLNPMTAEDFFTPAGKVKVGFRERTISDAQFDIVCGRCYREISTALHKQDLYPKYLVPYHEYTPMIKSHIAQVFKLLGVTNIYKGITHFRDACNRNQYLFPIYELLTGNSVQPPRTYIYTNMQSSTQQVASAIMGTKANIFVLNDNHLTDFDIWTKDKLVLTAFEQKFPVLSKYEIKPKVTICICVYNVEQTIERCIRSIPNRGDVEILLLDDKSTDNTLNKAVELLHNYRNFCVLYNNKNMGVGYNRNVLLERANGQYIFFLDGDDYLYTDVFNKIIDHSLSNQELLMVKYTRNDGFTEYPTILRGVFINKSIIGETKFNPLLRCYEDLDFKKRLFAEHQIEVCYINDIIYHYNKPRIGSLTWEYRKAIGDPSYQKDEELWEKYRRGKRG